ncbi:MAG: SdpI family protein [Dehalococcoidia bacterium]|jgi:hypothetical protein
MNSENIYLGSILLGLAVLFIAISIPLVKRKVKMNPWYGVRIPKSFESEENWYKINAYGGKRLMVWSSLLVLISIATFFIPLDENSSGVSALVILLAFSPLIVVIPAIIEILSFSRKM